MSMSTPKTPSRTLQRAASAALDEVVGESYSYDFTADELRGFCLAVSILARLAGRQKPLRTTT